MQASSPNSGRLRRIRQISRKEAEKPQNQQMGGIKRIEKPLIKGAAPDGPLSVIKVQDDEAGH